MSFFNLIATWLCKLLTRSVITRRAYEIHYSHQCFFIKRETNMVTQSIARTFILESSLKFYHSPPLCIQHFLLDEMKLSYFTSRELDTILPYLKNNYFIFI